MSEPIRRSGMKMIGEVCCARAIIAVTDSGNVVIVCDLHEPKIIVDGKMIPLFAVTSA